MKHDIQQFDNFVSTQTLELLLEEALSATEYQWSLFNEEANGPFWANKRLITNEANAIELTNLTKNILGTNYTPTISNKVQRFFYGDVLGPLVDQNFNEHIKFGSILFLNDVGRIDFPDIDISIKAETNKFVLYPADMKYAITSDKDVMYLITIFFTQN